MKLLSLAILAFTGCASTTLYDGRGGVLAHIQGDAIGLEVRGPGVSLSAASLTHSIPTESGGRAVAIMGSGVAKAVGAAAAASVTKGL